MITPSFGLAATERVLPKLALDFTKAALDSRITFTRATGASNPATYVNNIGVITAAANDQPRFDYDPVTLACKGLLIEESRANLTTYSSDLGNATWTKSATTVSTDAIASPDGTVNADKLIDAATTAAHYAFPAVTAVTAGTTYTGSCYFKAAENTFAQLTFSTAQFGSGQYANFNLSTGVVTAQSGGTATIQNAGNGWYRCTFTAACTVTGVATCICAMLLSGTAGRLASYAGNASNGLYIWGAQLEAGAFATSYIPTTTAALTRNADVATMTGTNFSDWFNASEGTLVCEFDYIGPPKAQGAVASINNNTTSNRLLSVEIGTTSGLLATSTSGFSGATLASMVIGNTYSASLGVNATQFAFAYNGNAATQQAGTINATTMTQLEFGGLAGQSTRVQNIRLKNCYYYPQRMTNNEIRATSK